MVYGEKLDTFDESRKDLLKFQNAAMEFIGLVARIGTCINIFRSKPIDVTLKQLLVCKNMVCSWLCLVYVFTVWQCSVASLVDRYVSFRIWSAIQDHLF